jgi:hypothetical protein
MDKKLISNDCSRNLKLIGILLIVSLGVYFAMADLLVEGYVKGDGTLDQESYSANQAGRVMVKNASLNYEYKRTEVSTKYDGIKQTFDQSGIIVGADGSRMNQITFKTKGADVGQDMRITDIKGNATFDMNTYLIINPDTGDVSFDSVIDAKGDRATFKGRLVDARSGKPLTVDRLSGVGEWEIWKHVNVTTTRSNEDWLQLCNTISDQLTPSVGPSNQTAIIPVVK